MCGPIEGDDVFVTCFVEYGSEVMEFAVEKCFPNAASDRTKPFGSGSADPFCEDGDSSTVLVDACKFGMVGGGFVSDNVSE